MHPRVPTPKDIKDTESGIGFSREVFGSFQVSMTRFPNHNPFWYPRFLREERLSSTEKILCVFLGTSHEVYGGDVEVELRLQVRLCRSSTLGNKSVAFIRVFHCCKSVDYLNFKRSNGNRTFFLKGVVDFLRH